ncbi:MAG: RNA-binding protein hfq [Leptolyngbyaceae cyanobacterium bins.59]|nr:RNA-binding protein hfq [Leptolyngbyaceae cyanobacterium bins.59]
MSTELETGLPSIRTVQETIRQGTQVEILLMTSDRLTGKLRWQDPHCICLIDAANQSTLIWRQAIAYIKPLT